MYENIYGISCIENHVLAVLSQRGEKIDFIYHDCAMPMQELSSFLILYGIKQENFDCLQRVQDLLKKLKVISFIKNQPESIDVLLNEIRKCRDNEYILIRIKPEFSKVALYSRGLRPDHYVLIIATESGFNLYNDIPERIVKLTEQQLKEAFDGDFFKMTILRNLNYEDANYLWLMRNYKPEIQSPYIINEDQFFEINEIGVRLRNLTGIYKILRRRMAIYYGLYINTDFIRNVLPDIDKLYALLQYYNLKKNIPLEKYYNLFLDLNNTDEIILKELQKRLENSNYAREKNKQYFNGNGFY